MGNPDAGPADGPSEKRVLLGSQATARLRNSPVTFASSSSRAYSTIHTASARARASNIAFATGPSSADTAFDRVKTPALSSRACPTRVETQMI